MQRQTSNQLCTLLASLLLGLVAPVTAAPAADSVLTITPDALDYREDPRLPGTGLARVHGDPTQGPYLLRARFDPGARTPPHTHPDTRIVTVLEGIYRFGAGSTFDSTALQDYGPGVVLVIPAGTPHFSEGGRDGAVVQESGTGPTGMQFVEP
ncbi:cupin domain-containing protein [Sinimarinibacterium sp. CAU 1509]|uniref:cupin domain-containing protein n=1 Tax=Sinimarinibacterium sp. CAU 1509 TaxID=2562283 RepID=UPI0010AB6046|nr:cupin domain-containing protein [Sinimarinibacterium sp. CAU 1509]TJY58284.1 cupin domain-containing protein [Sinimarinibacterium sp. CAU 1509]